MRGGYSRSFTRLGLADFTGEIGDNPGVSLERLPARSRSATSGALPLLLRESEQPRPGAASRRRRSSRCRDVVDGDITIFSPDLAVPYCRHLAGRHHAGDRHATMSIEARYLGARSAGNWRTNNYNELNIIENGFLDEFKLAMANLQANNAAGGTRAGSFAYFGPGTGTAPLPIFLGYFNGVERATAPATRRSTRRRNFRSTTYVTPLARFNPDPYAAVDALRQRRSTRRRDRALTAGLPANFFVVNPDLLGGANIVENDDRTMYHSMALEFRRRIGQRAAYAGSYVFGHGTSSRFLSLRVDSPMVRNGGTDGDVTPRVQAQRGVSAAVRPRPAVRQQRQRRRRSDHRRLAGRRQRARAERPTARPRQRAPGRDGQG